MNENRIRARNTKRRRAPSLAASLVAALAALAAAGSGTAAERPDNPQRPNILFVFCDDHAYQAISAYQPVSPYHLRLNETPNIDRLAREGMRFDNCYVTNSICGPCRAVVQTGKYSHLNGFFSNGDRFNGDQQTFPKLLQRAGYQTAIVGKWHLASDPQGYDYWNILIGQGPYYNPPMIANGTKVAHAGYTTNIITDIALDWLKNGRDPNKPFMLMYQHKAPHREWEPGPDWLTKYDDATIPEPDTLFDDYSGRGTAAKMQDLSIAKTMNDRDLKLVAPRGLTPEQLEPWNRAYEPKNEAFRKANPQGDDLVRWKYQRYMKDYLRCIAAVDDNLGRVLKYLDDSKLADNTVVIYTSDQGFYLGEHGWFDKRWMYQESLRTALVVRWPGVVKPGSVNGDIVSNLDFAETFLDIAGVRAPDDMQGRSLVPLLKGETPADWRKLFYYHYYEFPAVHSVRRHYGVTDGRYKLIHFYPSPWDPNPIDEWELYDLQSDPKELKSVHGDPKYAEVRKRLESELARLRRELKVPEEDPPQTARGPLRKPAKPESAPRKSAKSESAKPNVVFFLADDLRPDALGALGHPIVKTPNLDRLVERGQVFRNAYTMGSMHGAVCLPSRTMLLTGQSLFRAKNEPSGATPDSFTFPRAMKEAGYATVHAGKFGNSPKAVTQEFDESSDPGQADAVADAVIDFIRRKAGQKPLFVYMAGKEPHDPQYATDAYYARYRPEDVPPPAAFAPFHPFDNGEMTVRDEKTLAWPRTRENVAGKLARYYASISFWDAQVGRVLKALDDAGHLDNTIFIIAGDNGLSLGEHGLLGKQNLYQFGGMHVPLVFAGKGISKGETHALAYLMDIFPTVCELTGIPKPGRAEGLSLAPVIRGEKPGVRDCLFTAYGKCQRAVTDGRWKLIRYPLIDKTQLFDLQADPHEENDLAARSEQAETVREMMGKLAELQRQWADEHPLVVDNPKPQAWSPEKLTERDIESQKEETAVSSGQKPRKSGPGPRKK